jgi:hypothetical protein
MNATSRIGLGNTVQKTTKVFHGGLGTRDSFGRVSDLSTIWLREVHGISYKLCGELRVLIQAMMEFGFPEENSSSGQLELAIENQQLLIALRFSNYIVDPDDDPEKTLVQFWLNSPDSSLIKRILHHQDLVEVRFSSVLNVIEWRIIRSLDEAVINFDALTFKVFTDSEKAIPSNHETYVDMGDVDYENWLSEIYSTQKKGKSGDLYQDGESVQREQEWARTVLERERKTIDQAIQKIANASSDDHSKMRFDPTQERIRQYEELLIRKEKNNLKFQDEIFKLKSGNQTANKFESNSSNEKNQRIEQGSIAGKSEEQIEQSSVVRESPESAHAKAQDAKMAQVFREKAKQMYEMAKALQLEKLALEKELFALKRGQLESLVEDEPVPGSTVNMQMDDLVKKVDRLTRALESEKQKVKMLSDRVTVAEKEAQSASPLIEDLEAKVETTLKNSQQYKKETEAVKQKLVQAEAEKNKIKNELIKAQAQIQTLNKRLAG